MVGTIPTDKEQKTPAVLGGKSEPVRIKKASIRNGRYKALFDLSATDLHEISAQCVLGDFGLKGSIG